MLKSCLLQIIGLCITTIAFSQDNTLNFSYNDIGNQILRESSYSVNTVSNKKLVDEQANEQLTDKQKLVDDLKNQLVLYPNPTKDIIYVNLPSKYMTLISEISLIDFTGKTIPLFYKRNKGDKLKIDFTIQPTGIYIVQFRLEGSLIVTKRIIKE